MKKCKMMKNENVKDIDNQIKSLNRALIKIKTVKILKQITESLKISLVNTKDDIVFDSYTPDVFVFNNIAFNVKTGNLHDIQKTDYITTTVNYNYVEPADKEYETIINFINDIHPDIQIKKSYISVLLQGMTGHRTEKFILANGSGGNGKGALNELFMSMLGGNNGYGYKGNTSVLTNSIKTGPNPEIANLSKKRFTIFTEPNDNEDIQGSTIKQLTGDPVIDCRALYSSGHTTHLFHTMILECNKKPQIAGKLDNSIVRRFFDVPFKTCFTNDKNKLETLNNCKPCNDNIKDNGFKTKHGCALFKYLLNEAPKAIYTCPEIEQRTKTYIENCDYFLSWFEDNYQFVKDNNKYLKIKRFISRF